jgi:hypothetical protein
MKELKVNQISFKIGDHLHNNMIRTLYSVMIDDEDMNKKMIEQINLQGDQQEPKTSVKGQMTTWEMWTYPGFDIFAKYYVNIAHYIVNEKYKFDCKFEHIKLSCLWGTKYKSGEIATEHDHWPATFGCVYYMNPPKDCTGLYFRELDYTIKPVHGQLTIFDAYLRHEVPSKPFKGNRYCVSGNITIDG